jgi:hypothetical protein
MGGAIIACAARWRGCHKTGLLAVIESRPETSTKEVGRISNGKSAWRHNSRISCVGKCTAPWSFSVLTRPNCRDSSLQITRKRKRLIGRQSRTKCISMPNNKDGKNNSHKPLDLNGEAVGSSRSRKAPRPSAEQRACAPSVPLTFSAYSSGRDQWREFKMPSDCPLATQRELPQSGRHG